MAQLNFWLQISGDYGDLKSAQEYLVQWRDPHINLCCGELIAGSDRLCASGQCYGQSDLDIARDISTRLPTITVTLVTCDSSFDGLTETWEYTFSGDCGRLDHHYQCWEEYIRREDSADLYLCDYGDTVYRYKKWWVRNGERLASETIERTGPYVANSDELWVDPTQVL